MIRNEFRFVGIITKGTEEMPNDRYRFYVEVEQKKSGRATTYPIFLHNRNNRVKKERIDECVGKAVWLVGYVDNFDNHLSLFVQNFMELKCPN